MAMQALDQADRFRLWDCIHRHGWRATSRAAGVHRGTLRAAVEGCALRAPNVIAIRIALSVLGPRSDAPGDGPAA